MLTLNSYIMIDYDVNLFKDADLPEGVDREALHDNMIIEYGNFRLSVFTSERFPLTAAIARVCSIYRREIKRHWDLAKYDYDVFITAEGTRIKTTDNSSETTGNRVVGFSETGKSNGESGSTSNRTINVVKHDEGIDQSDGTENSEGYQHEIDGVSAFNVTGFSNVDEKTIDSTSHVDNSVTRETNNDGTEDTTDNTVNNSKTSGTSNRSGNNSTEEKGNATDHGESIERYSERNINNMDLYAKEWEVLEMNFYNWLCALIASKILITVV